jgi:ABC-type Zn uptake system ZnuABC Zn-binding protein ZnuA
MFDRKASSGRLARSLIVGLVMFCMALLACGDDQDTPPAVGTQPAVAGESATPSLPPIRVVATTNFVADWVREVGGDRVEVFGLLPPGGDPHSFQPGARDVARVADADVVFTVGLELEAEWLEDLLQSASAHEARIVALGDFVDPMEFADDDHDDHADHDDRPDDSHGETIAGRLVVADAAEAHLSVIDLSTDDVDRGIFEVAAPGATVYPSPTHRYAIVLARGPEDGDDRIHVFDGGMFLVPHGDHYDLVSEPVSRHSLEIVEEMPVHYVNSHGWTTIFTDTDGHVILINEEDLAGSTGDYEPIVLEAGPQHGAALVISEGHVALSIPHPEYLENPNFWNILPEGVEVRTFDNELVFDAGECHRLHGESRNAHGAVFGCWDGTLFLHAHDGEYESELIPYPPEAGEYGEFAIGQYFGHHHSDHFFGQSTLFPDGECCVQGGVWLVDVAHGEMSEVFAEPSAAAAFSSDGETFYMLAADGVLRAFDAHDGELIGTMQLVGPFEMVFGSPAPAIIVGGDMMYVADPNSGHVLGVHLTHMEIEEEWHVGGAPSSLAFVGIAGSGDAHEDDEHGHEEDGHAHHHHGPHDPHFWFDPIRVTAAVNAIADRLAAIDPANADAYMQNAVEYGQELDELHAWTQEQVSTVPPERRLLVTSHDSLSYFAAAYGFEIVGLVIPSLATHVEPSAEHIAGLVDVIREHNVPALFGETTVSDKLAQAVARETGATLVQLYSGSLGPEGSGADTYLGMVRTNVERIVEALK